MSNATDDEELIEAPARAPSTADGAAWLALAANLGDRLARPLDAALEPLGLRVDGLSLLRRDGKPLADGPAHLLVHAGPSGVEGEAGGGRRGTSARRPSGVGGEPTPVAVLACAAAGPEDPVREEAERAVAAADALGPDLGRVVVRPLTLVERGGASWALYPLCRQLERRAGLRWLQRAQLRGPLLRWLARVTSFTGGPVKGAPREELEREVEAALERVAGERWFSPEVRARARRALGRLHSGLWTPRWVLSHGDLWTGNVLLPPAAPWPAPPDGWPPFVLIDWRGSAARGHAFYDLLRLAESLRLPPSVLRWDVQRHARLLDCHPEDAFGYLLASLGALGARLGHFDRSRYTAMSERLVASLAELGLG